MLLKDLPVSEHKSTFADDPYIFPPIIPNIDLIRPFFLYCSKVGDTHRAASLELLVMLSDDLLNSADVALRMDPVFWQLLRDGLVSSNPEP